MINWITLLAAMTALVFPSCGYTGSKAGDGFCPIVTLKPFSYEESEQGKLTGYLLGAWSGKTWLEDNAAAPYLRGGEKYRFYSLDGEIGAGIGNAPHPFGEENDPCNETKAVSFAAVPAAKDGFVAVAASSNALPRTPVRLSVEQQVYRDAVAAILREKGIARPDIRLTQVVRVDLDGDGSDEVLVSACHYAKGLNPGAASGDYSVVLLRRVVKGRVATSIIEGDFYPRGLKFGAPGEHKIGAILDLNGDGVMEIILFGRYYEGDWAAAYRLQGDKTVKVFTAGCGL